MTANRAFVFFAMMVCFLIGGEYAITRPASQSIFLSVFSSQAFPSIWLATVPLNFLIVLLYNRFLPSKGPLFMMAMTTSITALFHLILAFALPFVPQLIFLQFCWKDIYILLMFKQLWSMIHSTIPSSSSKKLYGIIFSLGTCGSITGGLIAGYFAPKIGSVNLFLFTFPIYALLFFSYVRAYRMSGAQFLKTENAPISTKEGFSLIRRNRHLLGILLLVVLMQVSVALVEFQFSHQLELAIPSIDLRTAYTGKLFSIISSLCLPLQFIGSLVLLRTMSLRNCHFLVPLLLLLPALFQAISPGLLIATIVFVSTKSMDFSIFAVIREMLFVPLRIDEKYRAKAVIDVFAYRTSKAAAALMLIGLQFWIGTSTFAMANYISLAVFCLWIAVVAIFLRKSEPVAVA